MNWNFLIFQKDKKSKTNPTVQRQLIWIPIEKSSDSIPSLVFERKKKSEQKTMQKSQSHASIRSLQVGLMKNVSIKSSFDRTKNDDRKKMKSQYTFNSESKPSKPNYIMKKGLSGESVYKESVLNSKQSNRLITESKSRVSTA